MIKNQGTKQREQRTLGDRWQWKANGQCSKGDSCSFRHDMNKRAKSTQPNPSPGSSTQQSVKNASRSRSPGGRSPSGKWLDCRARITSKEVAPLHSVKSGILQSACSTSQKMDADLRRSALMHIARLMNSLAKGLKRMVTEVQWLFLKITRQLGCEFQRYGAAEVFIDFTEELKHTETNPMYKNHKSRRYVMLTFETKIHRLE